MDADLAEAFEVTWPAAEYIDTGGFRSGRGFGAGGRVSSTRVIGTWSEADIGSAIRVHQQWDQHPMFRVLDGDTTLAAALVAQGFQRQNPTAIMDIPASALTDIPVPRVTTFAIWPPLAIQRDIWREGNISAQRQAVMQRVPQPRISILGRIEDRAAGAAFAAVCNDVAMVHCVEVLPFKQRKGLAQWMMRQAAFWAVEQGASRIGLAVSRSNSNAVALYRQLGFREVAGYGYFTRTDAAG